MPFDWKTPTGYLITNTFQAFSIFQISVSCSGILIFMAGVCFILIVIVEDIGNELAAQSSCEEANCKKLEEFTKKCFNTFQFYSNIKQYRHKLMINYGKLKNKCSMSFSRLAYEFSNISNIITSGYYLWSMIMICTELLIIHLEMVGS